MSITIRINQHILRRESSAISVLSNVLIVVSNPWNGFYTLPNYSSTHPPKVFFHKMKLMVMFKKNLVNG